MVTYYVVQAFQEGRKGILIPDDPQEAASQAAALSRAKVLATMKAGVIAFSRTGDPDLGIWEDATVLCQHGLVPADLMELAV